ncbi:1-(5-phosphoribosyl)-5-[(5-phosphoribosylamino)methylideneamino]imidazole-4-carboxamide isomerase [Serinicoccus marinus]|uniref:1-(5-phosphoribosyl)-5-[(5- phosphoribosylamino)methylideneamino]imidazole-4- carboxamide isomerase n=1 Tax=Serinicoccus marinus TaxID=247333 RepID=UPI000402642F|nr:1-(5-phosphoribosyl)-5-[(5-phosphoribosylamino)methylideneamino]imidazole-4-carboxamide isomerase [Serinicoccus marinus]
MTPDLRTDTGEIPVSTTGPFTVYPAIDVRGGAVVRLHKGDYEQETRYTDNPVAVAANYARCGAAWLHLVDLDAARAGGYTLLETLETICETTGLRVQTGGGVRSADDVQRLLDAGAERVVVGSLSVREPATVVGWLDRFGADRITVALDTRIGEDGRWVLPTAGWTSVGEQDLTTTLHQYHGSGLQHVLCTDIGRDGTLSGPNFHLYTMLTRSNPALQIQASGGARSVDDVRAAKKQGCAGIILGKALLEGRLTVDDAVREEQP